MQPAIFIYYIKMKSFNTIKIRTESQVQKQTNKKCTVFYMVYMGKQANSKKKIKMFYTSTLSL